MGPSVGKKASSHCQGGSFGQNIDQLIFDQKMILRMLGQAPELKLFSQSANLYQGRQVLVAQHVCARSLVKAVFPSAADSAASSQSPCCSSSSHYASFFSGHPLSQCLPADPSAQISLQSFDPEEECLFFDHYV